MSQRETHDHRFFAGIGNRLIVAFLTVTMIPVVVLAIYGTQTHLQALSELASNAAADEAVLRARKLQTALAGAQSDLFYLTQVSTLNSYIEATERAAAGELDYLRDRLAKQFETFVTAQGRYRAVAYADSEGREVVRAQQVGRSGRVVPFAELSSRKPREDVSSAGRQLLAGQTLTMVERRGDDVVVSFVARLFPRGTQRRGYVILEIALSSLWEEETADSDTKTVLLDHGGKVLLGDGQQITPAVFARLSETPNRPMDIGDGRLATYVPIRHDRINPQQQWSFVAIASRTDVFSAISQYRRVFTIVLVVTLLVAGGISVLLARQFTVPLRRLYAAAQEIGHGRFDVELEDQTGDEIGGLANELRAMADKLKLKHEDMQQEIDDKTLELLQAERLSTIGRLSAAIAHEVNNPIGIISMYAQMLLEQLPADDPQARKLQTIVGEASRMSVLVRGLLQFARSPELKISPVDLRFVIDEAVEASAGSHEGMDQIEIRKEIADDCPVIQGDADQLGQVLRNLVTNAFHAIASQGTVTISARVAGDGQGARVEVTDTGHGIEQEHLSQLFEPFFTTKRFGAGTGLGLSISKEIVERHGGRISVESVVGEGTTFRIELPLMARPSSNGGEAGRAE